MNRLLLLLVLSAGLLLVLACDPGSTPAPTATSPGAGTATATPTATPQFAVINNGDDGELPAWLTTAISSLERAPVANPPISIFRYEYRGQQVYYQTAACCDLFTTLYDAQGTLLGHPDGGGDGQFPDFTRERTDEFLVWTDQRVHDPSMVLVQAPIDLVDLNIMESFPLQYSLSVTSGLPNACQTFGGYTAARDGAVVRVEVLNWKPMDPNVACAQVYGIVDTTIALGSDFNPNILHTVEINGRNILEFQGDLVNLFLVRGPGSSP